MKMEQMWKFSIWTIIMANQKMCRKMNSKRRDPWRRISRESAKRRLRRGRQSELDDFVSQRFDHIDWPNRNRNQIIWRPMKTYGYDALEQNNNYYLWSDENIQFRIYLYLTKELNSTLSTFHWILLETRTATRNILYIHHYSTELLFAFFISLTEQFVFYFKS